MAQRSDSLRLVAKALQERDISRKLRMKDLDSYPSFQTCIERFEDRCRRSPTHATQKSVPIAKLIADAYGLRRH